MLLVLIRTKKQREISRKWQVLLGSSPSLSLFCGLGPKLASLNQSTVPKGENNSGGGSSPKTLYPRSLSEQLSKKKCSSSRVAFLNIFGLHSLQTALEMSAYPQDQRLSDHQKGRKQAGNQRTLWGWQERMPLRVTSLKGKLGPYSPPSKWGDCLDPPETQNSRVIFLHIYALILPLLPSAFVPS